MNSGPHRAYPLLMAALLSFIDARSAMAALANASAAEDNGTALEEVVVTAQRREQSLQSVPISITTFSAEQMRELGIRNSVDIASQTPGVLMVAISTGAASVLPSIRGVSQNDYSPHQEMPSAIYVDDAYVGVPSMVGFNLFDLERTEILRGPQGTLFGRNATGGAVQFISAKPTKEDTGYVDVSYGSYSEIRVEAAASGSITDRIQGRFSLLTDEHRPWWENRAPSTVAGGNGDSYAANNLAGRGQLNFNVTDNIDDLVSVTRAEDRHHAEGVYKSVPTGVNSQGLGYPISATSTANGTCPGCDYFGYRDPNLNTPFESSFNGEGFLARQMWMFTNKLTVKTDPFTVTSVSNYQLFSYGYNEDTDSTPFDVASFPQWMHMHQVSQEIRLDGMNSGIHWTAGAYYLDLKENVNEGFTTGLAADDPLAPFGFNSIEAIRQETRSFAGFGQVEYEFMPTLTLTAGLRWSFDRKDFQSSTADPTTHEVYYSYDTATVGDQTLERKGAFSGKIGLDWKPTADALVYAEVARGVKGPGFNATPTGPLPNGDSIRFRSEELTDYEAGYKLTLWDGKARLNGSVYYYDYRNYQAFELLDSVAVVGNNDATLYGTEFEVEVQPALGWYASVGVSLEEGLVKNVSLPNGDIADRIPPEAPHVTANAVIRREWILPVGRVGLQFDSRYIGWRYSDVSNAPITRSPGAAITDARLSYTPSKNWDTSLGVKNLFNRGVVAYAFDNSPFYGSADESYLPPRWITLDVRFHW